MSDEAINDAVGCKMQINVTNLSCLLVIKVKTA